MEKRNGQLEHGQPMEQTIVLLHRLDSVWLAVNFNTSNTSGE